MEMSIKSVHFDVDDLTRELIQARLEKVEYAADRIQDLDFTLTKEKDHTYELEAKVHFRWGLNAVVKTTSYDLGQGIHDLTDKLDQKIRREVDKVQDHKG